MFRKMLTGGHTIVRGRKIHVSFSPSSPQHNYSPQLEELLNYHERDEQLVGTIYEFARSHEGTDVRLPHSRHDSAVHGLGGLGLMGDIIPENWLLPARVDRH